MALINKAVNAEGVKMTVGQTVTGYVTGFDESNKHPGSFYIVMQDMSGKKISVSAKGNLRYLHSDGKIELGQYTEITRKADRKNKKGQDVSVFDLLQDPDRTIGNDDELTAAGITSDTAVTNIAAKATGTTVAQRAANLAKSVAK